MHSDIAFDDAGFPVLTEAGPFCGNCGGRKAGARHSSGEAVKHCYWITQAQAQQAEDDWRAEQAAERALEDRGFWEARAQDDYEAANGVIDFDTAYRLACPELFADDNDTEYLLAASQR